MKRTRVKCKLVVVIVLTVTFVYCVIFKQVLDFLTTESKTNFFKGVNTITVSSIVKHKMTFARFGIITDLQYADIADGTNFLNTRIRRYRQSLQHLQTAILDWKSRGDVDFLIHLGDIIDGQSKHLGKTNQDLSKILQEFSTFDKPVYYIWGNHEYYNLDRKDMVQMTNFNSSLLPYVNTGRHLVNDVQDQTYFDWSPCSGFRLVFIDTYDISMLGHNSNDNRYIEAEKLIKKHNPNADQNSPSGMVGLEQRFVKYNGGIGTKQLLWLSHVLTKADADKENVIVLGHIPLEVSVSDDSCLVWNFNEVLHILHAHPSVRAYFAGHSHDAASYTDDYGVTHVTFPGIIEIEPDSAGHSVVSLTPDSIMIEGMGKAQLLSTVIPLKKKKRYSPRWKKHEMQP